MDGFRCIWLLKKEITTKRKAEKPAPESAVGDFYVLEKVFLCTHAGGQTKP